MTRVLLLCSGPWVGLKILYCLRAAGYQVDVLAGPGVAFKASRYIRKCTLVEFPATTDTDSEFTFFVRKYVEQNGIDCVIGDQVETQILINKLSERLGPVARFPGMATNNLQTLNDKWAFNRLLRENDLPGPPSLMIRRGDDISDPAITALGFPVILKPLARDGGQGVVKVEEDGFG